MKKIISLIAVTSMLVTSAISASAFGFDDIKVDDVALVGNELKYDKNDTDGINFKLVGGASKIVTATYTLDFNGLGEAAEISAFTCDSNNTLMTDKIETEGTAQLKYNVNMSGNETVGVDVFSFNIKAVDISALDEKSFTLKINGRTVDGTKIQNVTETYKIDVVDNSGSTDPVDPLTIGYKSIDDEANLGYLADLYAGKYIFTDAVESISAANVEANKRIAITRNGVTKYTETISEILGLVGETPANMIGTIVVSVITAADDADNVYPFTMAVEK